ncbi:MULTISPECIES: CaiB/BaiF CoA transferase family protein [unclassified Cytobacillus]|uniref:CaiB/BaiF CoA transferase family protein n=1 Tax=unclassified Cytobacillus TaxID=2675268 RepID=UPI00203B7877|nr:CaiB/BaiF CoA-transferase family protein [Cytobacillus sp. AMY 15.2]MCM3092247.1 CoA transferase [Cytobacillus sp. AMY 15.2]
MLKGIRIIDFSNYLPGPFASQRIAELGAEVIKVEPVSGDPGRHLDIKIEGTGAVFAANNRGKKSITLDLKSEEGKNAALMLISESDAVLESFRPGVMKKLGLDYETVKKHKPNIVYCSLTGYGEHKDYQYLGSHDLNYMAVSGVLAQLKDRSGRPVHPTHTIADFMGGLAASERILAALLSSKMFGKGGYHCISIAEVMASTMGNHLLIEKKTGYTNGLSVLNGEVVAYSIYETKDARFAALAALEPKFWINFCENAEREDWIEYHLSSATSDNPVYLEITEFFKSRTLKDWTEFGQKADCCLTPVLESGELADFPLFNRVLDANGKYPWVKMHGGFDSAIGCPPDLGENNEELLSSIAKKNMNV